MNSFIVISYALTAALFSTQAVGALINARDTTPRIVFAHLIVGNTYPYTLQHWMNDINLAHAYGIDAFALNIGLDTWEPDRVKDAYTAAQMTGTGFKLFISFDMTVLPCASPSDAASMRKYITQFSSHPSQFKYNNMVFASTFRGEGCTFGQGSVAQGWASQFLGPLTGANSVYFVPTFFGDPKTFSSNGLLNIMDGCFNWDSAWPVEVTPSNLVSTAVADSSANSSVTANKLQGSSTSLAVQNIFTSFESDATFYNALHGKTYLAAVSPWFFTHYPTQTFNKNYVYLSDSLYASRWSTVVQYRNWIPMIEIISWNDYGESTYVAPTTGAQQGSQAWVDGYDHSAWLHMTKYFATAYKTGSYPAITNDIVYVWARPHPKDANAPDSVGKPKNYELFEDAMFAVVLATQSATLQLNSHSFNVPPGFSQYSIPMAGGDAMKATLIRNGAAVVKVYSGNYTFNPNPPSYNYNAFVTFGCSGNC